MENTAKPIHAREETQDRTPLFSKILKVVAYPLAAVSGFIVTHTSLRSASYQKAKNADDYHRRNIKETTGQEVPAVFHDVNHPHFSELGKDLHARNAGEITSETFIGRAITNKGNHSAAMQAKMEELGLGGFHAKWKFVNRGSKTTAIIDGMTVAGITIGAMLAIANSKAIGNLFSHSNDDKNR